MAKHLGIVIRRSGVRIPDSPPNTMRPGDLLEERAADGCECERERDDSICCQIEAASRCLVQHRAELFSLLGAIPLLGLEFRGVLAEESERLAVVVRNGCLQCLVTLFEGIAPGLNVA
jgi:hypothetical protein